MPRLLADNVKRKECASGASRRLVRACILFIVSCYCLHAVKGVEISIPMKCRTEGRITFTLPVGDGRETNTAVYQLAFTESIDSQDLRSVVSIGYVGYEPTRYYTRDPSQSSPIVTLGSDGICTLVKGTNYKSDVQFIPEIATILELMVPKDKFKPRYTHQVGPMGLVSGMNQIAANNKDSFKYDRAQVHRNIPCDIYSKTTAIPDTNLVMRAEVFVPTNGVKFRNLETTYFSIKVTISDVNDLQDDENKKKSFLIDFFNIESADGAPEKFDSMRNDFNLPFGRGCSVFFTQNEPEVKSESFSMKYSQASESGFKLMAYDHLSGYLRKETIGGSVSIWDIKECLLYHIDDEIQNSLNLMTTYKGNVESCSVLSVQDDRLGPAFRPFEVNGIAMNVLYMIGALYVTFMGRGTVRDLPCLVYETILPAAPVIFALKDTDQFSKITDPKAERDYIVQFFVIEGEEVTMHLNTPMPAHFWPAKIVLHRRFRSLGLIEYVDHLDVLDFYWSLDGWSKKGSQLFMASECFDDEDEQVRLEMAVTFDKVHQRQVKEADKMLIPYNKFKLEYELINDLFGNVFQISKMHLVDYELKLRPNHVNLNMIIGDRSEDKKLVYFGDGQLPTQESYMSNRVILTGFSETSCLMLASHVSEVSMVLHCRLNLEQDLTESCIVVYDENSPTISNKGGNNEACRVYKFEESTIPDRAVHLVQEKSVGLARHPFEFTALVPEPQRGQKSTEQLKGVVKTYDLTHEVSLITVDNYMYTLDANQEPPEGTQEVASEGDKRTKMLDTLEYKSEGDCARVCDLDVTCRSYSYCSMPSSSASWQEGDPRENLCILSSLDVRASRLPKQLMSQSSLSANKQLFVEDLSGLKYKLEYSDYCNIYERDYLNMFRHTDELIELDSSVASQFQSAASTFDCAKQSVDLEEKASGGPKKQHHVAMFAYCATSNTCLLDENLFSSSISKRTSINDTNNSDKDQQRELLCRVYRKKYQTYFKVSGRVHKREPSKQVELTLNSVEECARACWIRLGQVCGSFDYCLSPSSVCLVNTNSEDLGDSGLEARAGCLHYERDLSLDELQRHHLIGPHEIYQNETNSESSLSFGRLILNLFSYALILCAFIYGLFLGRQVNDKYATTNLGAGFAQAARSSTAAQLAAGAQQMFNFAGLFNQEESRSNQEPDYASENHGIRLDVINRDVEMAKEANGSDDAQLRERNLMGERIEHEPLERDF